MRIKKKVDSKSTVSKNKTVVKVPKTKIYKIITKEISIWSGINVGFEFYDKEKADAFIEAINNLNEVDIEFEHVGFVEVKDSAVLRMWLEKSTKDYVSTMEAWAKSFTREHSPGYVRQYTVKPKKKGGK